MSEAQRPASEHRLTRDLRQLLLRQRTAALGTLDGEGQPFVSLVPYAIDPAERVLVIHVSALAAHTRHLQDRPTACLLISEAERAGEPVHALPRVSLSVRARALAPDSAEAAAARRVYLERFPEAEPMTALGDFRFVRLEPEGARQVAGFGAARSLAADEARRALAPEPA